MDRDGRIVTTVGKDSYYEAHLNVTFNLELELFILYRKPLFLYCVISSLL